MKPVRLSSRSRWLWASLGVLLLALLLRLFRLDAQSLWLDEGGTWSQATTRSWGALLADLFSPRASYPLYHLLMKGWIAVAGDSVWALRFPSALGGAVAVVLTFQLGQRFGGWLLGGLAALVLLLNPFALFQAQDAKVYSLLLAVITAAVVALVQALQSGSRRDWLIWAALVALSLLLHRLALLSVIGQVTLIVWQAPLAPRARRLAWLVPLALSVVMAIGFGVGLRQDPNAPPVGNSAGPLTALWVLLGRLTLDRAPGDVPLLLLPFVLCAVLGGWALWQQAQAGQPLAGRVLLTCGALPVLVYLLVLAFGLPIFEPRYVSFVLGLWSILIAAGLLWLMQRLPLPGWAAAALALLLLLPQSLALLTKPYGLWSGASVKEDYRAALTTLAQHVTPDDVVVVHPAYIKPLYRYYASRVSANPLPEPQAFGRVGALGYTQGEFDNDYAALLAGHRRAWLVIAPLNAATIDPPNPQYPQDDMGVVGINFMTADMNGKWRCIDQPFWAFNGVRLLCQSFPRQLQPGSLELRAPWPVPASPTATWAAAIDLLGYQLEPWSSATTLHPGGTLPLQLTWQAQQPLEKRYRMFIHLLPAIGAPVAAQRDTEPLYGGLPTSQWPVGQPIHDEVAVPLPADMPPGRYTVVLGWYDPTIPEIDAQRLPVTAHSGPAGPDYIELGQVEVQP